MTSSRLGRRGYWAKTFFLDLSYKLTPACRLSCLSFVILAFLGLETDTCRSANPVETPRFEIGLPRFTPISPSTTISPLQPC